MINKQALSVYLIVTFGITIILTIVARLNGLTLFSKPIFASQIVILIAMFIPATSAIATQKIVLKKPLKDLGFTIGPWTMYLKVYLGILAMYLFNYSFTWLFVVKPDFTLANFMNQFGNALVLPFNSIRMISLMAFLTFIVAPLVNIIPSLGEEIGWRGFLLPQLEPLGKVRAMIYSGMIWALWHTPMILILGFGYGKQNLVGAALHFVLVTGFGIWVGYVWFKTRSTILASFMHATFNANAYGVWIMLFVSSSKLIVGPIGVIGASLSLIAALIVIYLFQKKNKILEYSQ